MKLHNSPAAIEDSFVILPAGAAAGRRAERFDIAGYVGIPFPSTAA